jgi:hypothetical protein
MTTRDVTRGLGILVLLLTGAFGVSAQSLTPGREILFYNQSSAMAAVGQFDDYGNFVTVTTYTPDFVPWTSVVSTPYGILYYSKQTGQGMLGWLDAMGNHTIIRYYDPDPYGEFGAGWTNVVSSGGYLFFYNSLDGSAMVVFLQGDGSIWRAVPLYGFSPGWTHIVSTQNGLLFYSSNNGAGAVGLVNSGYVQGVDDGGPFESFEVSFQQLSGFQAGSFSLGWTSILETNNGVLFYRQSDGLQAMVDIDSNGGVTTRPGVQYLQPGYTAVVASGGNVLFYNAPTGDAALGQILPNNRFVLPAYAGILEMQWERPGYFSPGWTHVLSLFY